MCTLFESQYIDSSAHQDGSKVALAILMERLNLFFTFLFTVELVINAYSHWFGAFVTNMWSILDTVVIVTSLASIMVASQPTSIVRILRALRVIRIFGRVKSLKKIVSALTMSLLPVLNVFLILFLLISIGDAATTCPVTQPEN